MRTVGSVWIVAMLLMVPRSFADGSHPVVDFDIEKDAWVVLYNAKVELAKRALERQQATLRLEEVKWRRSRHLIERAAISREEMDTADTSYAVEFTRVKEAEAKVGVFVALRNVVKFLRMAGKEVPIFPEPT